MTISHRIRKFNTSEHLSRSRSSTTTSAMAVARGNTVYLRGQTARISKAEDRRASATPAAQTEKAMQRRQDPAGGGRVRSSRISVKITVYITDRAYREAVYGSSANG